MQTIKIRGQELLIDIEEELSAYQFDNARWQAGKLIASSPFRQDRAPSFFVNLDGEYAGTWGDSGAHDDEYAKGNFVKLIALLNDIAYEDAERYLIDKYGALYEVEEDEPIRVRLRNKHRLIKRKSPRDLSADNVITYATSPYLERRGITGKTQAIFGVGYNDRAPGFTAIAWRDERGILRNVKYRSTTGKAFFYERGAAAISTLVFGIHDAEHSAVLCEGEIDAMSWREAGIRAIALGGANLSARQADIIKRSKIRRLYLGGDNDEQGARLNAKATEELRGHVELYEIDYGKEKDANDVLMRQGVEGLRRAYDEAARVRAIKLRKTI